MKAQALQAVQESAVVVFLIDGKEGMHAEDKILARHLRKATIPVVLAVNKLDRETDQPDEAYSRLGLGEPLAISAIHGRGDIPLLDAIVAGLGNKGKLPPPVDKPMVPRIAIVGQPNVGKSSLFNRVAPDRVVVSDIPGTTHDPIDVEVNWKGRPLSFIDTAGIRRTGTRETLERLTVLWATSSIDRAHVALLLVDPVIGVTAQEQHLAALIIEKETSCVVAINKWDLLEDIQGARQEYADHIRTQLGFLPYVPVIFLSALKGDVDECIDTAVRVFDERGVRLKTSQLMDAVKAAQRHHRPAVGRRKPSVKLVTQAKGYPPTFTFFVNDVLLFSDAYRKYFESAIRDQHLFMGTPLRLFFRKSAAKAKKVLSHKRRK